MKGVYELPAILLPDECADIVRRAENDGFRRARLVDDGRKNDEAFLIDSDYLALLGHRLQSYFREIEMGGVLEVYRYGQGQGISAHVDDPQPLASGRNSNMTLVVYLSDDFDGGGTIFPQHEELFKPSLGGGLLFDQTLVHSAQEVRRGFKYVARTNVSALAPL